MKELPTPCGVRPPPDLAYLPCELAKGHPGGHTFEPVPDPALREEIDGLKNDLAEITDLLKPMIDVISKWYGGLKGGNAIAVATQLLETMADRRNAPPSEFNLRGHPEVEEIAQRIYQEGRNSFDERGVHRPWVPGGNSLKQDECRRKAWDIYNAKPSPPVDLRQTERHGRAFPL